MRWFDPGAAWASSAEAASGQRAICGRRENMGGKNADAKGQADNSREYMQLWFFQKRQEIIYR